VKTIVTVRAARPPTSAPAATTFNPMATAMPPAASSSACAAT
jgi:hypothetical protein